LMTIVTIVAAAALLAIGLLTNVSNAMPLGKVSGIRAAIDDLSMIDKVQSYWWSGRRYCWYDRVGTDRAGTCAGMVLG
jgi:hypothetical protein